ncbi:MAG TPA: DUF262 domain-containing protein [Caulobacteraceae bacterium]|nr:DUF262 domain-containing protein [Caulobacteraceae bacterium]
MYKPGGTIAQAVSRIQQTTYVLPAIQREFVWKPEQIERLFDSLMQGYPFGTFLFWKVEPSTSGKFKFYDFVRNYHQRDAAHCPELGSLANQAVIAVLDGQQRLTALNIGLRGSMAIKEPNKWRSSPDAFPKRTLRLNLLSPPEADEDGAVYEFRFLDEARAQPSNGEHWFPVPEILGMKDGPAMLQWLQSRGLAGEELTRAYGCLDRLYRVVHAEPLIHYYEEEAQDLERVLNIFIRLNSGGTVLSYSDLLLSIAVAQWDKIDARAEIHSLVDELNRTGTGFNLSKDFVLKAGLMLADIASVGFKVDNFTHANMATLEANWPDIRRALIQTVELVSTFGLNGQTLRADSSLLPIAYYLYGKSAPDNYVTHSSFSADRENIRGWLIRSLLKPGIWGSGLDTLLTALRETIQSAGYEAFPVTALRHTLAARGKSLAFEEEEIEELLSMSYGDKRLFALLALLFPFVDLRNQFHMDHIFPISRFTLAKLRKANVPQELVDDLPQLANQLPNLQLLEGAANNEKRAKLPRDWLSERYSMQSDREHYCAVHELGEVPGDLLGFADFHAARRERLRAKLKAVINAG